MAQFHVRASLRLPRPRPGTWRWALPALLLGLLAGELFSAESVLLTTYYPGLAAVYNKLITTGTAFLASKSGTVSVGGTASGSALLAVNGGPLGVNISSAAEMLHVNGDVQLDNNLVVNGFDGFGSFWAITRNGSKIFNVSGSVSGPVNWFQIAPNGNEGLAATPSGRVGVGMTTPASALHVAKEGIALIRQSNCRLVKSNVACNAGEYQTVVSGLLDHYPTAVFPPATTDDRICCQCPALSCPAIP